MSSLVDQVKVPFLTVFFALFTFFLLGKAFGGFPFTVTNIAPNYFTSSGVGEMSGVPGKASASFGVTVTSKTENDAKDQANKIINKITNDFKGIGVEDKAIKTSNFSSNPERDFSGKNDITGYTVNEQLDVTFSSVELANKGVDLASADGANQIGSLSFTLDEKNKSELEDKARALAIIDAKEKASRTAKAAGIRLGRVINISEDTASQPRPMYDLKAANQSAPASEPTQLNPGENKVSLNVILTYEVL
jgi:uncharacterized protein YggE